MNREHPDTPGKWRKIVYPTTPLSPRARRAINEKREPSKSDKTAQIEVLKAILEKMDD